MSVFLSVCLCVCLSMCLSVCLPVYASVCLCVCLSNCLYVCLSVWLCICLCICLFICPSVCPSVCLSVTSGDNLIVVWDELLVRALCHLLFVWVNICVFIYWLVFMFSCSCERNSAYLYVMDLLLQCTALSSFLNLPTLPLSSYLFYLIFSTVLNCPFLYTSSPSFSLLHFTLYFSTHLCCHFPYSSSLHRFSTKAKVL